MPPRHLAVLASLALILACEQAEPHPELLLRNTGKPVISAAKDPGTHVLEYVRSYGSLNGALSFTAISALAVHPNGIIAAYDPRSCRVYLIQADTFEGIGRCGDGPGELHGVRSLTFQGDTILVYSGDQLALIRLRLDGSELDRRHTSTILPTGTDVTSVLGLPNNRVAVALAQLPAKALRADQHPPLLVILDLDGDSIVHQALAPPPIADDNPTPFSSGVEACAHISRKAIEVAIKNIWSFEGMILDQGLRTRSHFLTPLRSGVVPFPEPMTGYRPSASGSAVACAEAGAIYWDLVVHNEGRRGIVDGGHLEVRGYDGTLLLAHDFTAADTALHGRPAAALGDRVFFRANSNMDFPQILEFRIRPRRAGDAATVLLP